MFRTSFVLALLLVATTCAAQNSVEQLRGSSDAMQRVFDQRIAKPEAVDTTVYEMNQVDTLPEYAGGMEGLMTDLAKAFEWQECVSPQGRVSASYVVEIDGRITDVRIEHGVSQTLDAEALRGIRKLRAYTRSATIDGRPVRVRMLLPINFRSAEPGNDQ